MLEDEERHTRESRIWVDERVISDWGRIKNDRKKLYLIYADKNTWKGVYLPRTRRTGGPGHTRGC